MANIAFDSVVGAAGFVNPAASKTLSFNNVAGNCVVGHAFCNTADDITGATYNGVAHDAMYKVLAGTGGSALWIYAFVFLNAATGTHDFIVSASASVEIECVCDSYSAVDHIDGHTSGVASSGTSFAISLTTTVDNCYVVFVGRSDVGTLTAGAGTTIRISSGVAGSTIADSGGVVSPAGSKTLTVNGSSGAYSGIVIALAPVGSSPSASISPSSSLSPSVSASSSVSPSASVSPSSSRSPSASLSPSVSASSSVSASVSPSSSISPSLSASSSASASVSPSSSRSPSVSASSSASASVSPSSSRSPSASLSPSASISPSTSASPSVSPSSSLSPSPGHIASVYVAVDGVQYATDRLVHGQKILHDTLHISDARAKNTPATCQFTAFGWVPRRGQDVTVALGSDRIFGGEILSVYQIYVDTPSFPEYQVECIDYSFALKDVTLARQYTNQSGTVIANDLITRDAPTGYTAVVQAALDTVDRISFAGNTTLFDALQQLAKRIGGYFYVDYYKGIHLYETEATDQPDDLTSTHPSLQNFFWKGDNSQRVTRALVEGGGVNALSAVAQGDTLLPVETSAWYNPAGGMVVCGSQRITYTGVVDGGAGSLVGPGFGPTSPVTLTPAAGAGVESGAHNYAVTFVTAAGESLPSSIASITVGAIPVPSVAPLVGSPTPGGSLDVGSHDYVVTFVNAAGETTPSPISLPVTIAVLDPPSDYMNFAGSTGGGSVDAGYHGYAYTYVTAAGETTCSLVNVVSAVGGRTLSFSVAVGPTGTTQRKLYRTTAQVDVASAAIAQLQLVGTIADNVTLIYADSLADAGLGANVPTSNTAVANATVPLSAIPLGGGAVTDRKLYRRFNGTGTFKLVAALGNNTATTYTDTTANASLGAAAPSTNTATANQVAISAIPSYSGTGGPVTARKLYRTVANSGAQLKLLATIANNTATTYTDSTADASLGANVPTSDTSGLTQPSGTASAGAGSLPVAAVGWASATGGWAVIGNGTQVIRYYGISGNTLTGIPANGIGSITAPVNYNSTITPAPALTGISSAGTMVVAANYGATSAWAQILFSFAPATGSAIAFDAETDGAASAGYSHTTGVGTNRRLYVLVQATTCTAVTYNGIALALAGQETDPVGGTTMFAWLLDAPATGAHAVAITATGLVESCTLSYTGCAQTGTVDAIDTSSDLTLQAFWRAYPNTVADNCWTILATINAQGSAVAVTGATKRKGTTGTFDVFDSGAAITPAGRATSIQYALTKGDPVNLLVQVDDIAAQATLAVETGRRGIREDYSIDGRISETEARARALARLSLLSPPLISASWDSRDYLTASGATIHIDLPSPTNLTTDLVIQQVDISAFSENAALYPTFTAQAASTRVTFEDLVRQMRKTLAQAA